jgi:hypothetical protein
MKKNKEGTMVPVDASDSEDEEKKENLDIIKEEDEEAAETSA